MTKPQAMNRGSSGIGSRLRRLAVTATSILAVISLGIIPSTALADETDDSLAGLTDEELAQLDEQLGIMPMAYCYEAGAPWSDPPNMGLVAIDTHIDGVSTAPPTNTNGGKGNTSGIYTNNGLKAGVYCDASRLAILMGSAGDGSSRPSGTARATWTWTMSKDMWVYVESGQAGFDHIVANGPNGAWRVKAGDSCTAKVNYSGPHGGTYFSCGGKTVDASNQSGGNGWGIYSMAVHFTTLWPGDGPEPEPDPMYYTLSYNKNASDATGSMSSQTEEEGTRVTVSANRFTRPGYTFIGWATSPNGSVVYQPKDGITLNSDITLYAKWQKDVAYVDLNYDANGGNGSHSPTSVEENTQATIPGNLNDSFNRPGYELTGWNTDPNGNGTSYQPGATVPMGTTDKTLYAQWDPITVQITYDPNGGNGSHEPTEGDVNTTITIPADVNDPFHRDHYTLTGWNTKPDGSGDSYAPGDGVHMGVTDQTLYAQWKRIPVKVNYDPNGGNGSHDPTDGDAGDPITIPDDLNDPFSKPGSILIGWNTKPDGTGDSYQPGDDVPMDDEDKTLYAQWKELVDVLPSTGGDGIDLPLLPIVAGGVMAMLLLAVGVVFKVRRSRR